MGRISLAVALVGLVATPLWAGPGYFREPALHGDTLVFVSEGDLWRVSARGGAATRLTTHGSAERHPLISPDGTLVAFSAQYEGPREVYTMPLAGGVPTRRTWEAQRRIAPVAFTQQGELVYATRHHAGLPDTQLVALDLEQGTRRRIPLAQAAEASFDASGRSLFFTRLSFQGSHTKRYRGGEAQTLWRFDGEGEARALTADYPGTSKAPMFWSGRLYFLSDRDETMNLWSMSPEGRDLRQHTQHVGWDAKSPSLSEGRVVYQLGADLRLHDLASGEDTLIPIELTSDFDRMRERWVTAPLANLSAAHLSPDGERVVLVTRGQVFVAPRERGRIQRLTRDAGVRVRQARFLPDGQALVALSDASGEVELWRLPLSGAEREQLTSDGTVLRWDAVPSPDGAFVAHHDKDWRLQLLKLEDNAQKLLSESQVWRQRDLSWSPHGRWLAWVEEVGNQAAVIRLHDTREGTTTDLTTDRYDSYSPAWSPDGDWLYFLSDRHWETLVKSPWGPRQPEPFYSRTTRIFALALRPGLRPPFLAEDELTRAAKKAQAEQETSGDEETPGEEEGQPGSEEDGEDQAEGAKEEEGAEDETVQIELAGIPARTWQLPVAPGRYAHLQAAAERLIYLAREDPHEPTLTLKSYTVDSDPETKPVTLADDVQGAELSLDRKRLLVRKQTALYVLDAAADPPGDLEKTRLDLSGWSYSLAPVDEWRQMLKDAWRLERDYFYDRGMHGVDWPAALEKYLPLVERVSDRAELGDLIAQMVSELSALHTFVYGGDHDAGPEAVELGFLGARLQRDPARGGEVIEHIHRADPDQPWRRAPLAQPHLDVRPGDVLTHVNGVDVLAAPHIGALLRNTAGRQTLLGLRRGEEAREVVVTPIGARQLADVRYHEWELERRERVEQLGAGKLGYVHLRAMGAQDAAQWAREFYPVFNRAGLIVDVRHNNGGNIDSWLLGKLLRRAWFYWQGRRGKPYWNMQYAFRGHLVVLVDAKTASDGEAFAEGFRRLGLGKVIGTRTWGGEIWLSSSNHLVDGGIATAAEFGVYGPEGHWLIEGHGVEPDIVVDNLPHATFLGQDAQLEAAVRHLLEEIEREPVEVPPPPPFPDKSSPDNRPG